MTTQFHYEDIIQSILNGTTESLMFVMKEKESVDSYGDCEVESGEVFFAGTTVEECRNTIDTLVSECTAEWPTEQYEFFAGQCRVDLSYFKDFDPECDDAEELINEFVNEAAVGSYDNVGTHDWNYQAVTYKYESLDDSILLYWSWETHVGYARKAIRLEYCIDNSMTTRNCIEEDRVYTTQITRLLTREEIEECPTASDLCYLIQEQIDRMGKWRNHIDVESFVAELYEDNDRALTPSYDLPANNNL